MADSSLIPCSVSRSLAWDVMFGVLRSALGWAKTP